jgi:hypothetical protein
MIVLDGYLVHNFILLRILVLKNPFLWGVAVRHGASHLDVSKELPAFVL